MCAAMHLISYQSYPSASPPTAAQSFRPLGAQSEVPFFKQGRGLLPFPPPPHLPSLSSSCPLLRLRRLWPCGVGFLLRIRIMRFFDSFGLSTTSFFPDSVVKAPPTPILLCLLPDDPPSAASPRPCVCKLPSTYTGSGEGAHSSIRLSYLHLLLSSHPLPATF